MGFLDIHSHVLPGVDDGPPCLEVALGLLEGLTRAGFERVFATPHQKKNQFLPSAVEIEQAHRQLDAAAAVADHRVELGLGAENYWDDLFFERVLEGTIPCYSGSRAFLYELPGTIPSRLEESLFRIATRGLLPVMAHPERNSYLCGDPARLERVSRVSALVVDLGAVGGDQGWRTGRIARRLLAERIAHAAASDIHAPTDLRSIGAGIAWIGKKLGPAATTRLLIENPRCILTGELPDP
ncbi:MAG: CpsB/CapC family capsule biosynthesis tyrosine phosphatase [Pseudomonadota bacterium]